MMKAENNLGILHYALENGIIDLSYVQEKVKMNKEKSTWQSAYFSDDKRNQEFAYPPVQRTNVDK